VKNLFPELEEPFELKYIDEDDDEISFGSTIEWEESFRIASLTKIIKIRINGTEKIHEKKNDNKNNENEIFQFEEVPQKQQSFESKNEDILKPQQQSFEKKKK